VNDVKLSVGELVYVINLISLWTTGLSDACDMIARGEVGMVLDAEDDYGWVVVMSPR
jgi:hypothetical protein